MAKSKKNASPTNRKQSRKQRTQRRQNRWLALVAAIGLVTAVIYFTWQETGIGSGLDPLEVSDPVLGPETAPIEIVEFGDFGCSSCRAWHLQGIRDAVLETYGDQVRFVWKDFPVITNQSPQAAEAAHCAAAQDKFWDYHDIVYEQYAGLNMDALHFYALQTGLDLNAFESCMERGDTRQIVDANLQTARRLGLRGTPGFTLNGQVLPAPPSFEQLANLIEQELAGAQLN